MSSRIRIEIEEVGQRFGCVGRVYDGKKVVHETRLFPYGFSGPARQAAEAWLQENRKCA